TTAYLSTMASSTPTLKLHGRTFYESIGSPKHIVAPMVDQSEFAWRLLTRSFLPPELRTSILAYSPMFHAKLFAESSKYRQQHFEPLKPPLAMAAPGELSHVEGTMKQQDRNLDGNPAFDRPLFVQFCANDPDALLEAAKVVQPYCDAVDLNLGCPQGIAKRGLYGAFLQEDWDTIYKLINTLHKELDIPVTAKIRIQETKEKSLEYAKMILSAGASILTVHGRQREQKGHNTGLADYAVIRYIRDNIPRETVMFANGNILQHEDIQKCLDETGVDGVMSAEGNLYDPSIFAPPPPVGQEGREYWRGRDGNGGYRCDAVLRRYMDIIHKYVLGQEPPARQPLYIPSDVHAAQDTPTAAVVNENKKRPAEDEVPATAAPQIPKKQRKAEAKKVKEKVKFEKCTNPNLVAMQAHCFHILRPLVSKHHNVRDALARSKAGDIDAYENVLTLTTAAVKQGILEYEADPDKFELENGLDDHSNGTNGEHKDASESSDEAVRRCKRPYFICQPYVRPLPKEALEKGSMQLSKKELKRLEQAKTE
ncbi:FMN-linked oxidoreductase, partial [Teratosphaeria nubilosa]